MSQYVITHTTIECYKLRLPNGIYWADITLDGAGNAGRIMIASDFGSWSNYWGSMGGTLKEFLPKCDTGYLMGKFESRSWFNHQQTLDNWKKLMLAARRSNLIGQGSAIILFKSIKYLEDYTSKDSFCTETWHHTELLRFFDNCPDLVMDYPPQLYSFFEQIWPVFIDHLKKELEEKKPCDELDSK